VPRAASPLSLGGRAASAFLNFSIWRTSAASVRASAAGCSRISSSMRDIPAIIRENSRTRARATRVSLAGWNGAPLQQQASLQIGAVRSLFVPRFRDVVTFDDADPIGSTCRRRVVGAAAVRNLFFLV